LVKKKFDWKEFTENLNISANSFFRAMFYRSYFFIFTIVPLHLYVAIAVSHQQLLMLVPLHWSDPVNSQQILLIV